MGDMTAPDAPDSWAALIGAVLGTFAITTVWRPLGGWVARRLSLSDAAHDSELSTCRREIKALSERFEVHRRESEMTIRRLSSEVAMLTERVAARDARVDELMVEREQRRGAA